MRKLRKFSGDTRRTPASDLRPHVGRVPVPPSAGPLPGLDGGVFALHGEGRSCPCPPTLSFPVLSRVCTYLVGPRARRGHRPRSSFPGLWPRPQLPGRPAAGARPRPCFWIDQSRGAGHGCTQSEPGRGGSPAGPAPGAAAPFGPRSRAWAGPPRVGLKALGNLP